MKTKKIILLLFMLVSIDSACQQQSPFRFTFESSVNWRSTIMNVFDFNYVGAYNSFIPFAYEWHIQGVSGGLGTKLYHQPSRLGVGYSSAFRYDYVHGTFIGNPNKLKDQKRDFLNEHHFYVFRNFKWKPSSKRESYVGAGIGLMNIGKTYWIDTQVSDTLFRMIPSFWFDLQFSTIDLRYGSPIGNHLYLESVAQFIPKTFPTNKERNFLTYSLRLIYTFENPFRKQIAK